MHRIVEASAHINSVPETVIEFLSDVRTRTRHLDALKEISDVQGDAGANQSWKWRFDALGMEFEGSAHSNAYEPGALYAFETEGQAQSQWTYRAEPEDGGTKLSLRVEYTAPAELLARVPADTDPAMLEQAEAQKLFANIKSNLDQ